MTFDERIKKTLTDHSQWNGSSDTLWDKISVQLQEKPQRIRQPLWLGSAVAALLVLAFALQNIWLPATPPPPLEEAPPELRMFSAALPTPEFRVVQAGANLELPLTVWPAQEGEKEEHPRLEVWLQGDPSTLVLEMELEQETLLGTESVTVRAPEEPGTYLLVVTGTVLEDAQIKRITAEETIIVDGS